MIPVGGVNSNICYFSWLRAYKRKIERAQEFLAKVDCWRTPAPILARHCDHSAITAGRYTLIDYAYLYIVYFTHTFI